MRRQIIGLIIILVKLCFAQSGLEIIERVDNNTTVKTAHYRARMLISLQGKTREKEFQGYALGKEFTYMEFIAPARDKGTRFLKINDEIWIFIPSIEKSTKIAGHMLRQNMMGSDFSYDDVAENRKLQDLYNVDFIGIDTIDDREFYQLELTAKVPEVNYYFRKMWVAKESYIPVKVELYAKSGKLLKEMAVIDFKKIGKRNYPTRVKMINKLRQDTYTELIIEDIEIDIQIPEKIFTKAYLERK